MSWLLYIILLVAALYLFKINPILCVAICAVVLFAKFWSARIRKRPRQANADVDAVLALLLTRLLDQDATARASSERPTVGEDPLGGLFLGDPPHQVKRGRRNLGENLLEGSIRG